MYRILSILVTGFIVGATVGGSLALCFVVSPKGSVYEAGSYPPVNVVIKRWVDADVIEIEFALYNAGTTRDFVKIAGSDHNLREDKAWQAGARVRLQYVTKPGSVAVRDDNGKLIAEPEQ